MRKGLVLIAVAMLLGACDFKDAQYRLSIVNSTHGPAEVTVSGSSEVFKVGPDQSTTFAINHQSQREDNITRDFHIRCGSDSRVVHGQVPYFHTVVVSVTGQDDVIAADYGYKFLSPGVPEGTGDVIVKQVFRQKSFFVVGVNDAGHDTYTITANLGETLPGSVRAHEYGKRSEVVRILRAPPGLVDNADQFLDWLRHQ